MKAIQKYPLELGLNQLKIPYIKILSVMNQGFNPVLYALVDTETEEKELQVIVCATGWDLDDNILEGHFLSTITDGLHVWHVFYKS